MASNPRPPASLRHAVTCVSSMYSLDRSCFALAQGSLRLALEAARPWLRPCRCRHVRRRGRGSVHSRRSLHVDVRRYMYAVDVRRYMYAS